MKGRANGIEYQCQLMFVEYNRWMGAMDDFDRLMSFHSVKLRSVKWWHSIFYFLIDVETINGLHLWRLENAEESAKLELRTWVAGLIEEILEKYGAKGGVAPDAIVEKEVAGEGEAYPDGHPGKAGGSRTGLALAADILADTERTTG
eukprot:3332867-Rhodomonas_salina.1